MGEEVAGGCLTLSIVVSLSKISLNNILDKKLRMKYEDTLS